MLRVEVAVLLALSLCAVDGFVARLSALSKTSSLVSPTWASSPPRTPSRLYDAEANPARNGGRGGGPSSSGPSTQKKQRRVYISRTRPSPSPKKHQEKGRISAPKLFEVFHPSCSDRHDERVQGLSDIANEKLLCDVLRSWYYAPAGAERCYEVLQHLRQNQSPTLKPNTLVYGAVMNAFTRANRPDRAESILRELIESPEWLELTNVKPKMDLFYKVIKSYARSKHIKGGAEKCAQLLNEAKKMGLKPKSLPYSALVGAYAIRGRAQEAERVLLYMIGEEQCEPDAITFGSVMSAWSKSDNVEDAPDRCVKLLDRMRQVAEQTGRDDVRPNVVAYTVAIDAFGKRGRAEEAEALLRQMVESDNVQPNMVTFGSVMNAWSKATAVEDAPDRCLELLHEMKRLELDLNVVIYSTIIDAFSQRGRAREAESLLRDMVDSKIMPNEVTYNAVMNGWSKSDESDGPDQCMRLMEEMSQLEMRPSVVTYSTIVDSFAKRGRPQEAETMLRNYIKEFGSGAAPRTMFNCCINAWAKSNAETAPERCMRLIADMKQLGHRPDETSFNLLIEALGKRGRPREAEEVLWTAHQEDKNAAGVVSFTSAIAAWSGSDADDAPDQCKRLFDQMQQLGYHPNPFTVSGVISAFARRKRAEDADRVFRELLENKVLQPSVIWFNSMLNAWAKSDFDDAPDPCQKLIEEMNELGVEPTVVTYSSLIHAFGVRGKALEAETVFRDMVEAKKVEPNTISFNTVLNAWAKSDDADAPDRCLQLLEEMGESQVLRPDIVSFATVIDSFGRRGRAQEADKLFRELADVDQALIDVVAFTSVMYAWSKSDDEDAPDKCMGLLEEMQNAGIQPNAVAYVAVLDSFAKRGRAEEAETFFRSLVEREDVETTVVMINEVLNAYSKANTDDAPDRCIRLLNEMEDFNLRPDSITYKAVIDTCANRGRGQDAEDILRGMLEDKHASPSTRLFNSVMFAWNRSSNEESPDHCLRLLQEMEVLSQQNRAVRPTETTYRLLRTAFTSHGREHEVDHIQSNDFV